MTLVRRTFVLFLAAFLLQMLLILGFVYFGYTHSEGQWKAQRLAAIEEAAAAVLSDHQPSQLPQDIPVSVYDAQGSLAASNRGTGRSRASLDQELIPIREGSAIIGYYSTGLISFRTSPASRELIETMRRVVTAGVLLALGISLGAASYFSRQVSRPAQQISSSLEQLSRGSSPLQAEISGCDEMALIARSVQSLQDRLQREQLLRSQWAQDIAHDLRTPVSSIKAQLEAMHDGVLQVTQDRLVKTSLELHRMEVMISDLETLMKLESPEAAISIEEINASHFAGELTSLYPEVSLDMEGDSFRFPADRQLLHRAAVNLITNAIRHKAPQSVITLKMEQTDASVLIAVHNTGTPIPEDDIPRVCDRLYRGEYARNTPGSGLGLTIVERIVKLHAGRVDISSSESEGTTVSIHIPRRSL